MKQHLWSNPESEWEGFQPVVYWLDHEKVLDLQLTMKTGESTANTPTTVRNVWTSLADKRLTEDSLSGFVGMYTEIETTDGLKLVVKGPDFNLRILELMLKLRSDGVNPFEVMFFYYDTDSCRTDPNECFIFFAAHKSKIIREHISFFDYHSSGFDPSVFTQPDHSNRNWGDERNWDDARARFWYRKFYSETETGQLMALRPDAPELFFQQDRTPPDVMGALGVIARSLNSVRLLLWVLVILTVLGFFLRWK